MAMIGLLIAGIGLYPNFPKREDPVIVIRTAVFADGLMHLGAGGAIVLDSDPVAEYDEMLLKTAAQMRALHLHTAERTVEQRRHTTVRSDVRGGHTATEEPVR